MPTPKLSYWWVAVFFLAAVIWSIGISRPVDLPNWHEFDYSSIARNFVHEGNNILLPRIDWRGDGPGYTEMEFPLIPWVMAQLYRVFGIHEIIGRLLSLAFALLSLWVFRRLALKVLSEPAALIATLFMAVSHEMTMVATAIQPEALMLLCSLLAVYYFVDWQEGSSWSSFALAICSFSLAMLIKSPAAHLAIFFLVWVLLKDGLAVFRKLSLYLFALLSFLPPLLWYSYAATLWHRFHNSMGVSNEDHWLGLDMLRRPKVIVNFVSIEMIYVFGFGAFLVVLAAVVYGRLKSPVNRLALSWSLAVAIYLVVIIRTAGANWAVYYHVVAIPPLALLFGVGISQTGAWNKSQWRGSILPVITAALFISGALLALGNRGINRVPGVLQDLLASQPRITELLVLSVLSCVLTVLCFNLSPVAKTPPLFIRITVLIGCLTYFLLSFQMLLGSWTAFSRHSAKYDAAVLLKSHIPPGVLIVASGGICVDAGGHRLASDAPNMFYWLDRKGFSTCQEHQSIAELEAYKKRGARYYVAEQESLLDQPGFEAELRRSFALVAGNQTALLFKLD